MPKGVETKEARHRSSQKNMEFPVTSDPSTNITAISDFMELPHHVKTQLSSTEQTSEAH